MTRTSWPAWNVRDVVVRHHQVPEPAELLESRYGLDFDERLRRG